MTSTEHVNSAEHERLEEARSGAADWRRWGTYVSERAWGTVREDYSPDGDAWTYFPFEQARSRAFRWNEDGLAGWCDDAQTICLGIALWNGRDPILKERPFGLSNAEGNHGEDVKDYWFYTDNLPTHAYASMVYKYPHSAFPYDDLRATNQARGQDVGEYELFDALEPDWRANRYFDVVVEYAKATPEDVVCRITATNRGPDPAPLTVLPQIWYRNTWSWTDPVGPIPRLLAPSGSAASGSAAVITTEHPALGHRWIYVTSSIDATPPVLFCENETNNERLFGSPNASRTSKDGIDAFVVQHDESAIDRAAGSKAAAHVHTTLASGASVTVLVRFAPAALARPFDDADEILDHRRAEADEFYGVVAADHLSADQRLVQRQAFAGLLWCKQYYHYAVRRWLTGDPGQPAPPSSRWQGRNVDWQHFAVADVLLMPDAWEYPWFASWDLAFHCATAAMIDPDFAKAQVLTLLSATTQHPHGQVPAYEWEFSDTNPPLQAWAAWQVYQLDRRARGVADTAFLATAYRAVSLATMWWLNRKDDRDRGVFGGGFLGMDNIGVFDRDRPLPTGGTLDQVDGTAWMAALVLHLAEMAVELAHDEPGYLDQLGRWVWIAWLISAALEEGVGAVGFWDEESGFYHDTIEFADGSGTALGVFSIQSVVPLFAAIAIRTAETPALTRVAVETARLRQAYGLGDDFTPLRPTGGDGSHTLIGVVGHDRLARILERLLDPEQFWSDHGIRSLSRFHRDTPYEVRVDGQEFRVAYCPAESPDRTFGGNSNWRGPIWLPTNFLLVQALDSYGRFLGDTFTITDPDRPGRRVTVAEVADRLAQRLTTLVVRGPDGRRAAFGTNDYFQNDPHWRDLVPFHEYFDGDTGRGLGASHQTGWTALIALLLQFGGRQRFDDLRD